MSNIISNKFKRVSESVAIDRALSNLIGTYGVGALRLGLLNKGVSELTEDEHNKREELVEEVIAQYNSEIEHAGEYATSPDSCYAEFVSDWGHGEGVIFDDLQNSGHLSDGIKAVFSQLEKKGVSEDDIMNLVLAHCETILTGVYYEDGEVFSATIGESEYQPNDELLDKYNTLTDEEKELVRRKSKGRISGGVCDGWIYTTHDYERFVSILDEDSFLEAAIEEFGIKAA